MGHCLTTLTQQKATQRSPYTIECGLCFLIDILPTPEDGDSRRFIPDAPKGLTSSPHLIF